MIVKKYFLALGINFASTANLVNAGDIWKTIERNVTLFVAAFHMEPENSYC